MPLAAPLTDEQLAPEIVAYAIPPFIAPGQRAPSMVRVKRVGLVYFIEQLTQARGLKDGREDVLDVWKGVAVAKGEDARREAFEWMWDLNKQLIALSAASPRRMGE